MGNASQDGQEGPVTTQESAGTGQTGISSPPPVSALFLTASEEWASDFCSLESRASSPYSSRTSLDELGHPAEGWVALESI